VRAAVALGLACDGACVFCAQDGLPQQSVADAAVSARLVEAREAGAEGVTFVGGEPATDERLEGYVSRARSIGFARIGVQSNGRALSTEGRVETLARAGMTDVHLSLHGAEAAVHDWHAGVAGAFDASLRTMAAARAAGLEVVVATVLTRSSFRVLGSVPRLLASRGAAAWCIEVPRWRGRAATAADRVVPRLALALPFALHALDAAASLGLPAFVRGAPACLLGPFVTRALAPDPLTHPRAFAPVCEGCPSRPTCAGVEVEYLARFGASELAPHAIDAQAGRDRQELLRSMFVGVGELAPPVSPAAIPSPPERARVGLPVLGRPAPARAEVPSSAAKQTGEALREILPGLFPGKAR
jgi:MoaA/NifB/PqqE/SkfB family radical SAM enzyme